MDINKSEQNSSSNTVYYCKVIVLSSALRNNQNVEKEPKFLHESYLPWDLNQQNKQLS